MIPAFIVSLSRSENTQLVRSVSCLQDAAPDPRTGRVATDIK